MGLPIAAALVGSLFCLNLVAPGDPYEQYSDGWVQDALQYTTLHYTTLHYTTLHYTTLHQTILFYSTI